MKDLIMDFRPNEKIDSLFSITGIQLRKSQKLKNFLRIDLYDKSGVIPGYLWHDPLVTFQNIRQKRFVRVIGTTKMIHGFLGLNVQHIIPVDSSAIDMRDFLAVEHNFFTGKRI